MRDPDLEWCDSGPGNGLEPDACRPDCTLPRCGDGVVDSGEACDDGNPLGGDGCTVACTLEEGVLEAEPDDDPVDATLLPAGEAGFGSLPAGDRDCWGVAVPERGWISAEVDDGAEGCPDEDVLVTLRTPGGAAVATSSPGAAGGCSPLDPLRQPGARFLGAGQYAICLTGFLDREVSSYRLRVETGDTCALEGLPVRPEDDPDGDGAPDACDDDDDGDGILDADDNCPRVPNGGQEVRIPPAPGGWIRDWLVLGPLTGVSSPDTCLPTVSRLAADDGAVIPELGQVDAEQAWRVLRASQDRVDLRGPLGGPTPREAFLAVWVIGGDRPRDLTLTLGPDDGARAWWNGSVVLEDRRCQGTTADANRIPVTLEPGWNRLVVQVYDQGGGWGVFARFLDGDGEGVEDLRLSLSPDGPWTPDQTDTDGDGRGDVCDETPAG